MKNFDLAISVIFAALILSFTAIKFKQLDNTVSVKGLAERVVESDEASFQISFAVVGNDTLTIFKQAVDYEKSIQEFLKTKGFAESEISKKPISVSDNQSAEYVARQGGPRFIARGAFIVLSDKVDQVTASSQEVLELIKKGIPVSVNQVNYYFTNLNVIKPEMLKDAAANAKEAAMSFARDSGARLGKIRTATQGQFTIGTPHSEWDSGDSRQKKVRVVTHVEFALD